MNTTPEHRILELQREGIEIVPYDERWPQRYALVEMRLVRSLPPDLFTRISHIGSTAVPGLSSKSIIDVQVEVTSLERVRREVVPIMLDLGYEYIWRRSMGEQAPFYAWFIHRDPAGERTEHVHMVEPDAASEARLLFRDHLRRHREDALRYETLKRALHAAHPNDRTAYTLGKTDFITGIVAKARKTQHP